MANPTQRNNLTGKKSFSQTIRQGAKVLGGRDVANYTLTYMNATKSHRQGDFQTIVMPYIELGRSSDCVVQFGDEYNTVSRKHAALRMDNGRIMVKHLSATNPTIIRRGTAGTVEQLTMENQEAELQNGDTLQLSSDGPSMRFNATETRTSSMGFTQRMQLFSQQALKPYRYAVGVLALLLVALGAGSWYVIQDQSKDIAALVVDLENTKVETVTAQEELIRLKESGKATEVQIKEKEREIATLRRRQKELEERIDNKNEKPSPVDPGPVAPPPGGDNPTASKEIGELFKSSVFFIRVKKLEVVRNGVPIPIPLQDLANVPWYGTGYLTTDGKLITARHVLQGWRFGNLNCDVMTQLADIEASGGEIRITFQASSASGVTFDFPLENAVFNDATDDLLSVTCTSSEGEKEFKVRNCDFKSGAFSDWAYVPQLQRRGNIKWDGELPKNLIQGETLHVLGYSFGFSYQSPYVKELDPIYSTCLVGQTRQFQGMITISGRSFEPGNSGGPVFAIRDGRYVAVGIVSLGLGNTGRIASLDKLE